jgi:hypothetical protein
MRVFQIIGAVQGLCGGHMIGLNAQDLSLSKVMKRRSKEAFQAKAAADQPGPLATHAH